MDTWDPTQGKTAKLFVSDPRQGSVAKITEKTFISIFLIYIFWCNNGMGQCQSNVSVLVNFKITYCLRICQHHPLPRTDLHTDDPTTGCILIRQSRVTLVKTEPPPSTAQAGAGHCFSWWELFSHSSLYHAYVWMVSGWWEARIIVYTNEHIHYSSERERTPNGYKYI